jgi:hypothetical protein
MAGTGPAIMAAIPEPERTAAFAREMWYRNGMVKTLEIALSKAAALPEAAQEQLGREILDRIETLKILRTEIEAGIRELEAGLGEELDVDQLLRQLHQEHGLDK